jgi:hypothetical protein
MKRSLLATVLLVVGAAILAVGLVGARLMQTGPQDIANANGVFAFAIDANPWNDANPCASIDASNTVSVGASHQVAVCTVNEPTKQAGGADNVEAFEFVLTYDPLLNQCKQPDYDCSVADPTEKCRDDNPDINAGSTLGTGHVPTTPNLGTGWDCSGGVGAQPTCSGGQAQAKCSSTAGPYTSGGLSPFPLAIVSFTAIAGGTDTMVTQDNVWSGYETGEADPPPASGSAEVDKSGTPPPATSTPTATGTATPTATPCPDGICPTSTPTPKAWTKTPTPEPTGTPTPAEPGEPPPPAPPPPTGEQMPQVVPPGTGSGPDSIPWASTAVWLLAAAGAVSASLGGLCLRRAGHR